jgi:small multidrug resistance pump
MMAMLKRACAAKHGCRVVALERVWMGRPKNSPLNTKAVSMNHYIYIGLAVGADAAAACALKAADGFKVPIPSLVAMVGYGAAFFFLSQAVRTLPVGVANALWSGLSILAVAMAGYVLHRQVLSASSVVGLLLVCGGIALVYFGSGAEPV